MSLCTPILQGTEESVSLVDALHLLGLTLEKYEAQKKAPCRDIDLSKRIDRVIERFSKRGAGLNPSSYDLERVRALPSSPITERTQESGRLFIVEICGECHFCRLHEPVQAPLQVKPTSPF